MKQLLIDIITYLHTSFPEFQTVSEYQSQDFELLEDGSFGFMLPACFVEIMNPKPRTQMGNGVTLYDPLMIKFHVITEQYNMDTFVGNNNLDLNLDYYDVTAKIYNKFYLKEFNGAAGLVSIEEDSDTQPTNQYHFTSTFVTNFIDYGQSRPVNGQPFTPNYIINKQIIH